MPITNLERLIDDAYKLRGKPPRFAWVGSTAWGRLFEDLERLISTTPPSPFSVHGGDLQYRGVCVRKSEELPPNTILVGAETELDTAPALED